jgi:hypothetical protein
MWNQVCATDRVLLPLPLPLLLVLCSGQAGALLLLLAACVLLPSISGVAARPAQTTPPRKPAAAGNAGILSGRAQKGVGPDQAVGAFYHREVCNGFTAGTLGRCDPKTHEAACCDPKAAFCVSAKGDKATSFADKCDKAYFKDIGCCPTLAGVKMTMWDDVGCPGKRMAGPKPPRCPAQTVWACCLPADKTTAKGLAWESGCLRFDADASDLNECKLYPGSSYGCCPV